MKLRAGKNAWLLAVTAAAANQGAWAQAIPPSAAQAAAQQATDPLLLDRQRREDTQRQQERERLLRPKDRPIESPMFPKPPPVPSDVKFLLKEVDFSPSVFLTDEELQGLVKPLIGTQVDFAAINGVVDQVNKLYLERNQLFSRAFLPPQRIGDGKLRIDLIEAKADSVEVEGLKYIDRAWLDKLIATDKGAVIDAARLDRIIDRYQRATDARFALDAVPGKETGTSQLSVKVQEPERVRLRASINNEGNDYTGREQLAGDLSYFSPLGRGDKAALSLITSRGLDSLSAAYSVPLNVQGTRATASAGAARTHIIDGPFAANDIRGKSRNWSVMVTQPIWERRPWTVEAYGSFGNSHSETSLTGVSLGDSQVRQASIGGLASWRAETVEVSTQLGYVPFRSLTPLGTASDSAKIEWNASVVKRYEGVGALLVRANGQATRSANPLSSSGRISFGGVGLLRAYPAGSLTGDAGYGLAVEWYGQLSELLSYSLFAERGEVWGGVPRQGLSDVGATIEWKPAARTLVSATAAHGFNDGTLTPKQNRLYFKITQDF